MTKAEKRALEAYPVSNRYVVHTDFIQTGFDEEGFEYDTTEIIDDNLESRKKFIEGYEAAEKEILSKFTKEHLEGLKWIKRTGISTQPTPYHKYCKALYKVLEELLKEKYDI